MRRIAFWIFDIGRPAAFPWCGSIESSRFRSLHADIAEGTVAGSAGGIGRTSANPVSCQFRMHWHVSVNDQMADLLRHRGDGLRDHAGGDGGIGRSDFCEVVAGRVVHDESKITA